jgi:hypothetical protein
VTHNGSNAYYFADFIRFVDDGLVIIVLTSLDRDERRGRSLGNSASGFRAAKLVRENVMHLHRRG